MAIAIADFEALEDDGADLESSILDATGDLDLDLRKVEVLPPPRFADEDLESFESLRKSRSPSLTSLSDWVDIFRLLFLDSFLLLFRFGMTVEIWLEM